MERETRYRIRLLDGNNGIRFLFAVNKLGVICSIDKEYNAPAFTETEIRENVLRAQLQNYTLVEAKGA